MPNRSGLVVTSEHPGFARRPALPGAALAVCLALTGCAATSERPSTVVVMAQAKSPAELADRLSTTIGAADRAGFDQLFVEGADGAVADRLWRNLQQYQGVRFRVDGAADGVVKVAVSSRVGADVAPARRFIGLDARCSAHGCRLQELRPLPGQPAPLWLVEPVEVVGDDQVMVIAGEGARPWLEVARVARDRVADAGLQHLTAGWQGQLVVEAPASAAGFAAVMGVPTTDLAVVGAVTWVANTAAGEGESSATRIVVNPVTAGALPQPSAEVLLTHEAVHVATGQQGQPAPGRLWVMEGLAELVALPADPTEQSLSLESARAACVTDLSAPADADFNGGPLQRPQVAQEAYARSWQRIVQLLEQRDGAQGFDDIRALWTGADPEGLSPQQLDAWVERWCAQDQSRAPSSSSSR